MKKTHGLMLFLGNVLFVVFGSRAAAQATATFSFTFGATMEDTYKVFGPPSQWYVQTSGGSGHFLNSSVERDAALQVYEATFPSSSVLGIEDVYMRQTTTNLYRIKVEWLKDRSTSRLHPTMRLSALEMDMDKPAPAVVTLGDLPEATEICRTGCDLYAGGAILPALVFPSNPSPAQLQIGALLATNFKSKETKDQWSVGIKLAAESGEERAPGDFMKSKITTVVMRTTTRTVYLKVPVKVGTWMPESH